VGLQFRDEQRLARALLAAGGIAELVGPSREDATQVAIISALAPYRTADCGYQLENEWH